MGLFNLWKKADDGVAEALYAAVIAQARRPHWYLEGQVPDTIDGRFDMVAMVLALVLLRLEGAPEAAAPSVRLTERFVDDMDAQLRELGIGDIVVGKHMGKMMSMLGGRLGALREADSPESIDPVLVRNLYRGKAPPAEALAHVRGALVRLRDALGAEPVAAVLAGRLPA